MLIQNLPGLRPSEVSMGKFICGECGCGDKPSVFLNGDEQEYTKLDHPYLSCPRKMPGFTDYVPSTNENNIQEQRKKIIENVLGSEVLENKNLIKPEMSDEEKEESRKKSQEDYEKRQSNKKDCPDCQQKSRVRQLVIKELEKQGIKEDFSSDEYQLKFQELWNIKMKQVQKNKNNPQQKKGIDPEKLKEYLKEKIISRGFIDDGGEDFHQAYQNLWKETIESIQTGTYDTPDELFAD